MRYAFYSHGGCENHGCEAIVKTLSALIKDKSPDSVIKLYTLSSKSDEHGDLPNIDEAEEFRYIIHAPKTTLAQKIKISLLNRKSQKAADEYYYSLSCKNPSLKENDVYISVGGDNYCYGDGHMAAAMNRELKRLGKKTVIWGCSIGEEDLSEDKIKDLKTFDLIVARESLTYDALKKNGVDRNTVLYPDSAFTLVPEFVKDEIPFDKKTIGFNFSSMASWFAKDSEKIEKIFAEFLEYLLETTDKNIMMIPHVTYVPGGDQLILSRIAERIDSDRLLTAPSDLTAAQYKGIISQCDEFIGARTHATIAAYSTCVPTLVIGYSVKSRGIAKDIFGTYDGLVVPVDEIESSSDLINAYKAFDEKKEEYREHLRKTMPEYIARAKNSVNELFKI